MYVSIFIRLSRQLRNRDKHSLFIKYLLIPIGFCLFGLFPFLSGKFIIEEKGFIGGIFLMMFFFDILFLSFKFSRKLIIYVRNVVLFPFSIFHQYSLIVFQALCSGGTILFIIAVFSTGIILSKDIFVVSIFTIIAITVFLCFNIWVVNIFIISQQYMEGNKNIFNYILPSFFILSQIPIFLKKAVIYNLYPFSGWIGSTTNSLQNGDHGLVGYYLLLICLLLIIGYSIGQFLLKPGKKLR